VQPLLYIEESMREATQSDRPRRILVIEDDRSIRDALCDVLVLAGHQVSGAEHGRAGLEAIRSAGAPEVILLDLRMPVMGGLEFLEEFGRLGLESRVIVLTANPQDLPPDSGVRLLAKPYDVDRLLSVIDQRD
jgi:two-component system response regulator MprA